jgi:hypothetical protein
MSGLHIGDRVPNFALPNHKGQTWTLAQHLRDAPAMLVFTVEIGDHTATGRWSALPGSITNSNAAECKL